MISGKLSNLIGVESRWRGTVGECCWEEWQEIPDSDMTIEDPDGSLLPHEHRYSYTITGLTNGERYAFQVAAIVGSEGEFSPAPIRTVYASPSAEPDCSPPVYPTYRTSLDTRNCRTTGNGSQSGAATGILEEAGDIDWYRMNVQRGGYYRIDAQGVDSGEGTLTDPLIVGIYAPLGRDNADVQWGHHFHNDVWYVPGTGNDDADDSTRDSRVFFKPDTGGHAYVGIGSPDRLGSVGSYTVSVERLPHLTALGGNQRVTLYFDFGANRDYFQDYRYKEASASSYGGWKKAPEGRNVRTLNVTGLTNGTAYDFQMRRFGGRDNIEASATPHTDCAATTSTVCAAVVGGEVISALETQDDVDWFSLPMTIGTIYRIYAAGGRTHYGTLGNPVPDAIQTRRNAGQRGHQGQRLARQPELHPELRGRVHGHVLHRRAARRRLGVLGGPQPGLHAAGEGDPQPDLGPCDLARQPGGDPQLVRARRQRRPGVPGRVPSEWAPELDRHPRQRRGRGQLHQLHLQGPAQRRGVWVRAAGDQRQRRFLLLPLRRRPVGGRRQRLGNAQRGDFGGAAERAQRQRRQDQPAALR